MLAGKARRMHGLVHDVEAYALHSGIRRVIGFLLRDQPLEGCQPSEVRTVRLDTPVRAVPISTRRC